MLSNFIRRFAAEQARREYLMALRWPEGSLAPSPEA